ncbi:TPA: hypothetical protein ACKONR_000378 [Clostridioides difficile]|uniref:hypothetical protein n=1 Tax=Clostridioides difficile TaxID=1496 RepID=UPI00038C98CB|nr:hypothetical protein [Clostridioides difficile]EGT3815265.1 hypothetical protein [Clostridioides difficile]EGT3953426.1 hypothetical protein [Clostridioides difficile]EGT4202972.1 hypothetical protein [Clostridioides difficile]ELX4570414.1 hypothetical protein [Clostridioides difficile]EQJ94814.1 hypothetical protein QUA_0969 [Clostridioides difficile P49]
MDFLMSNNNKGIVTNISGDILTIEDIESNDITEIIMEKGFVEESEIEIGCFVEYDKDKKIII